MAITCTCTGVVDVIKNLKTEDECHIQVTFKKLGSYKVSSIMNKKSFDALKEMEVGQEVFVAANRGGEHISVQPLE